MFIFPSFSQQFFSAWHLNLGPSRGSCIIFNSISIVCQSCPHLLSFITLTHQSTLGHSCLAECPQSGFAYLSPLHKIQGDILARMAHRWPGSVGVVSGGTVCQVGPCLGCRDGGFGWGGICQTSLASGAVYGAVWLSSPSAFPTVPSAPVDGPCLVS